MLLMEGQLHLGSQALLWGREGGGGGAHMVVKEGVVKACVTSCGEGVGGWHLGCQAGEGEWGGGAHGCEGGSGEGLCH